jgi:mRNA interferase HigB
VSPSRQVLRSWRSRSKETADGGLDLRKKYNVSALMPETWMHLISRKKLREVWGVDRELEKPLRAWIKVAGSAKWRRFSDVRATIKHADQVDRFTVFNILGNRFRLICVIHYDRSRVFIRHVLSHAEYDRGARKRE